MLVVISLYLVHAFSIVQYPYFSPSSNVEELAYTYISSANFNTFGFLFTDFLQNFAASPDPADHPYVYSHMPPGPDVVNALLMRATDGSFKWTAIILATLVPVGFVFYLAFIRNILALHNLIGGGIFAALLTPWLFYLPHFTNPIWNGFLFLTFSLFFVQQIGLKRDKQWPFSIFALPVILISSLYLDYVVLSSIMACWMVLYLTQTIPMRRREVVLALGAMGVGIGLNLLKNIVYFGPKLFLTELLSVVSNRIVGWPSQQDMAAFYAEHGIVHHGAHPPSLVTLKAVIRLNFEFPSLLFLALAACAALMLTPQVAHEPGGVTKITIGSDLRNHAIWLVKLMVLTACIILTPVFLFPAFSQEVSLYGGTNFVWLGLLAISFATFTASRLIGALMPIAHVWFQEERNHLDRADEAPGHCSRSCSARGLGHHVFPARPAIRQAYERFRSTKSGLLVRYSENPHTQLEPLRRFASGMFMTNINVPTVYFFTRRPGFGCAALIA
jgi:hypothetical protein